MRLFRSPWPYLGFVALFAYDAWHDVHPRLHTPSTPWHPVFSGIEFAVANAFCICLVFGAARLTSIGIERAALALLAIEMVPSIAADLYSANLLHLQMPSFRLVNLTLNTLLAAILATRFIQVLREPPAPGILSQSTK